MATKTARTILSQADAAEYLGVSEKSLRRYVARGVVPAYRIGGSRLIRFRLDDLDALLRRIPTADGAA